jgi:uncharacterized protein YebE (UPF0316 family)
VACLLPLLIFVAEVSVVTVSTIRIIFLARGQKTLAAILGFFEISIWLFAIGQVMQNLSNLWCCLAFAAGFTLGNYTGVLIDEALAMGNLSVRIITRRDLTPLVEALRALEYGVTCIDAQGATGPVQVTLIIIKRKHLHRVIGLIKQFDPTLFYSINPVSSTAEGVFPLPGRRERPAPAGYRAEDLPAVEALSA